MPIVSVIITTHNRRDLVTIAIQSVLWQSFTDYELIIVDDASTDDTLAVVKQCAPYAQIISIKESKGANNARSEGLKIAQGNYIAFLDDDDWWFPLKLEKQVKLLDGNNKTILAGCWYIKRNRIVMLSKRISRRELFSYNILGSYSFCMFRRGAIELAGGPDQSLTNSQDWDLWLRLSNYGDIGIVQECLAYYATFNSDRISLSKNQKERYFNYFAVVKKQWANMDFIVKQKQKSLYLFHITQKNQKLKKLIIGIYYGVFYYADIFYRKIFRP